MSIGQDSISLMYTELQDEGVMWRSIAASSQTLNRQVLIARYLENKICREVCELYPRKATSGQWTIEDNSNPDNPVYSNKSTKLLRSLYAQKAFKTAATVANIIGSAVLIIDDGNESTTLPPSKPIALHLMMPEQFTSGLPEQGFYETAGGTQLIHESRVMVFHGVENPFNQKGWGMSVLSGFLKYYDRYDRALTTIGQELADRSIFTIKQTGLKRESAIKEQRQLLQQFFTTLRKGLDTLGLLLIDRDTMDAEWKERTFTGVEIPFSELRRNVIAQSDIPEMELFGVQDRSGLQEKGLADRLIVATKASELQAEWEPNLIKLRNAITGNQNLEIVMDSPLQMSPIEEADIKLKEAQTEKTTREAEKIESDRVNAIAASKPEPMPIDPSQIVQTQELPIDQAA